MELNLKSYGKRIPQYPLSEVSRVELSEGWESVSIIANPFQTYITGSRVAPLPIAVPLPLTVAAFTR